MQKDLTEIDLMETPLSESNVSLKLAEIQLRCRELLDDESSLELTLEEPGHATDACNPYNQG
ncbi:MAG: hypothetical protein ACR2RD_16515 [Woeseiaceae bacterium]